MAQCSYPTKKKCKRPVPEGDDICQFHRALKNHQWRKTKAKYDRETRKLVCQSAKDDIRYQRLLAKCADKATKERLLVCKAEREAEIREKEIVLIKEYLIQKCLR